MAIIRRGDGVIIGIPVGIVPGIMAAGTVPGNMAGMIPGIMAAGTIPGITVAGMADTTVDIMDTVDTMAAGMAVIIITNTVGVPHTTAMAARENETPITVVRELTGAAHHRQQEGLTVLRSVPLPIRIEALQLLSAVRPAIRTAVAGKRMLQMFLLRGHA